LNVKFQFNTAVISLEAALKPKLTTSIGTDTLTHDFDQVVLCVGAVPRKVMHALKASPPPARVTGYSLSANIREPLNAPRSAVMDLNSKIVISRMGNRVRVSGAGYLSGNLRKNVESETEVLYQALQNYFPGAIHMNHGTQTWVGSRSQYSDGLPCVGPSAVPGVWLNMGHGSNGWGMALGAARSIADLIDGRATEVNCEKFHPARWLA
jgi:D-amino-acid dehydrogenase